MASGKEMATQAAAASASAVVNFAGSFLSNLANRTSTTLPAAAAAAISSVYTTSETVQRDLDRVYAAKVRPLLNSVDQLRGLLKEDDIKLPTIVVVGDQSSGKSSVLEALSGVSLPRGQNITTRVPLVLRMVDTTNANEPYAIISTMQDMEERIALSDVSGRIEQLTQKLAGTGVGVVNAPITLSVYRSHCPDLTLVDLPGITRNPVGDQPHDIYAQIVKMIKQYITPEESIILNVMSCTVDFSTCECVMLSKEVDPQAKRTISVVTKMDLAEHGIAAKLQTTVDQLGFHLGLVGVRNRSQFESDHGVTWEASRENERIFFEQHTELKKYTLRHADNGKLGRISMGTSALAQLLGTIQEQHVRLILPRKRIELRDKLLEATSNLQKLPPGINNAEEAHLRLQQLLQNFMLSVGNICRGEHSTFVDPQLHLLPRLQSTYTVYQKQMTAETSYFLSNQFAENIQTEITANAGVFLPNFMNHQVFKNLIQKEQRKVRKPSIELVHSVRNAHSEMLLTLVGVHFELFPSLKASLSKYLVEFLDERELVVQERLLELLASEEDIFTLNAYYLDTVNKIKAALYETTTKNGGGTMANPAYSHRQKQSSTPMRNGGLFGSGWSGAESLSPSASNDMSEIEVNDLVLKLSGLNAARHTGVVLEMQIACLAYTVISYRRITDSLVMCMRYHFTRALYNGILGSADSSRTSLSTALHSDWLRMDNNVLMDHFKETASISERRKHLNDLINRLKKASKVFENL